MTWLTLLEGGFGLLIVLGVGWFAVRTARNQRRVDAEEREAAAMQAELEHDGVDDQFAHDMAQRSRDKGAV